MNNLKSYELAQGVNLRTLKTDKFKTNLISVYIRLPLDRSTVTKAALLPRILKRGTVKYPTLTELSKRSEELYGASLSARTVKKGDTQLLKFSAQFVSDDFISDNITKDVIDVLCEMVFNPKTDNGGFDKEYLIQEKENAKSFIEGLINDKKEYAQVKCNEIMFENDSYGIFEYGYVEDLNDINESNLYEFYVDLFKSSEIDIFACGSFNDDELVNILKESLYGYICNRKGNTVKTKPACIEENIKVKKVTENMPVTQSKLCIGFNCDIMPTSEDYCSMMLFSCIYGGSPFSKLFNNVREKLSLAYYVFSALDRQKGFMRISSGIEASNFEAAYNEIHVQLEKMRKGDFTDNEIISAKKYLETGMNSVKDSLSTLENFYMGNVMLGNDETPDDIIKKVNEVNREMIISAANRVQEDTIYFLKGVASNEV